MKQTDIKKLFNKARRILKNPGLDLLVSPTQEPKGILIVITPGKIGTAVARNTVRRRIKALFHKEGLDKRGIDAVVFVKKEGTKLNYAQLKALILDAISNAHL